MGSRKAAMLAAVAVAGTVVVTLAVQAAIAGGAAVVTRKAGGTITAVRVAQSADAYSTSSSTYVNIPNLYAVVKVPAGQRGLLVGMFSAETSCSGASAGNWCQARMTVNGGEMKPGGELALDSDDGTVASTYPEGHAFQASSNVLGPGTYRVRVQVLVVGSPTFRLDDLQLTVLKAQV